ncbi:MAG: hypothetical protein QXK06_05495 [Candidatus Diapherotrites archaeon]
MGVLSLVLYGSQGSTQSNSIIARSVFFAIACISSAKLFLDFYGSPERESKLHFSIHALRIAGGAFALLFLLALFNLPQITLIDFQKTDLVKAIVAIAGIVLPAAFYGLMVFAVFFLVGLAKRLSSEIEKTKAVEQPLDKNNQIKREEIVLERKEKETSPAKESPAADSEKIAQQLAESLKDYKAGCSREELAQALKEEGFSDEVVKKAIEKIGI